MIQRQSIDPAVHGEPSWFRGNFVSDDLCLVTKIRNGNSEVTERAYDAQGRLVRETLPGPGLNSYAPHTTSWIYDGLGRKVVETRPENLEVSWTYTDAADHRVVVYEDSKKQKTTYLYDSLGRLESTTYPDSTTESMDLSARPRRSGKARAVAGSRCRRSGGAGGFASSARGGGRRRLTRGLKVRWSRFRITTTSGGTYGRYTGQERLSRRCTYRIGSSTSPTLSSPQSLKECPVPRC